MSAIHPPLIDIDDFNRKIEIIVRILPMTIYINNKKGAQLWHYSKNGKQADS